MESERIEFQTFGGVTLRGDLFRAGSGGTPGIVMAQGLSLIKEH